MMSHGSMKTDPGGIIYAISDPVTKRIMYVGRTEQLPLKRWVCHLSYRNTRRHSRTTPLYVWMRKLHTDPDFSVLLCGIKHEELRAMEMMTVKALRASGHSLLNVHDW